MSDALTEVPAAQRSSEASASKVASPHLALAPWRQSLALSFEVAAGGLLMWMFLCYALGLVALYSGGKVWAASAWIALLALPLQAFWRWREEGRRDAAVALTGAVLAIAVIGLSKLAVGGAYDVAWDGVSYHQWAILHMVQGWPDFPAPLPAGTAHAEWIDVVPKGIWVVVASIYANTTVIEDAMLLQFTIMALAAMMVAAALLRHAPIPGWAVLPFSLLAAANPLALNQSLSFYVDGQLACLLATLAALLVLAMSKPRISHLTLLAVVVIFLINTKHTGIVYGGLVILAVLGALWRVRRQSIKPIFAAAAVGGLLAALVFGYSPYLTNMQRHGHPLYPFMGEGSWDIAWNQRPAGFDDKNRFARLAISTLSRPNIALQGEAQLRWPPTERDLQAANGADVRLGGWGPLFPEAFVLGLLALVAVRKTPRQPRWILGALLSACVIASLINADAWWARYSPMWFFVPLLIALMLACAKDTKARVAAAMLCLVLLANIAAVAWGFFPHHRQQSEQIQQFLQRIKASGGQMTVYFGAFPANRLRLSQMGIDHVIVAEKSALPCSQPERIFHFDGWFCLKAPTN